MSIKRLLRAPTSLIFDLAFPLLILLLAVASNGNRSVAGVPMINYYFSVALAKGLIPMACISFPISVARQIENGSVARLNYFGVKTGNLMLSDLLAQIVCATAGEAIVIAVAVWGCGLRFHDAGHFFAYILQIFYALVTLMVWGQILGFVIRNTKGLATVGIILTFFLLFCSSGSVIFKVFPKWVQIMVKCFPISWVPLKMPAVLLGHAYWAPNFLWISAIWLCAGLGILFLFSVYNNSFVRALQKQKILAGNGGDRGKISEGA